MLKELNKLNPTQFSRLCLDVIKKILGKDPVDNTIKQSLEKTKETLIDLMIRNNIKIYSNGDISG